MMNCLEPYGNMQGKKGEGGFAQFGTLPLGQGHYTNNKIN